MLCKMGFPRLPEKAVVSKIALSGLLMLALAGCPLPFFFSPAGWPASSAVKDPSSPSISAAPAVRFSESNGRSGSLTDGQSGSTSSDTVIGLSSDTVGAVIYYTLDGTTPDPRSSRTHRYVPTSPVTLAIADPTAEEASASLSVTATAVGPNMKPSLLTRATVNLQYPQAAAPTFSLEPGVYDAPQSLTLQSATPGAEIYYIMVNGNGPVARPSPGSAGTVHYSGAISLAGPQNTWTVSAIAVKGQMIESAASLASFTISQEGCANPTFYPSSQDFNNEAAISITSDSGSTIYYTLDNMDPVPGVSNSMASGERIVLAGGTGEGGYVTIRAIAVPVDPAKVNSAITASTYRFVVANVIPSAVGGTYNATGSISLSCATANAQIYCTLDGSDPLVYGAPYVAPIAMTNGMRLRAVAVREFFADSDLRADDYVLKVATPVFILAGGTYYEEISADFYDPVPPWTVYHYTLDESTPNQSSWAWAPGQTIPIPNGTTTTVRVIGIADGFESSDIAECAYSVYDTPLGMTIGWADSDEMDVSWSSVSSSHLYGYELHWSTSPTFDTYTTVLTLYSSHSFTGLASATPYYYRVRARYLDHETIEYSLYATSPNYWGATLRSNGGPYYFNVNLESGAYETPSNFWFPYFARDASGMTITYEGEAIRQGGYTFIAFGHNSDYSRNCIIATYDSNNNRLDSTYQFSGIRYLYNVDDDGTSLAYFGEDANFYLVPWSAVMRPR
jgi:hypothetical protein